MSTARTRTKRSPATTATFLLSRDQDFWTGVGIYEKALKEKADLGDLRRDVRNQLEMLGLGNLKLLCEKGAVSRGEDANAAAMAQAIMKESDENTLIHLREFLRRRTDSIQEVYEATFSDSERASLDADVENLSSSGRIEKIKPLTKLLLIYRKNPETLYEAFFLQIWRSRQTFLEFRVDGTLPADVANRVVAKRDRLQKLVSDSLSNREVELVGIHPMRDGTLAAVMHREYNPTIRRDFRQKYNVHFGCGLVVFGLNASRDRLVVKSGNSKLTDALNFFIEDEFGVKLTSLRNDVFADYDPKAVEASLLGGYKEDAGIEITSANFRRSCLPSRAAVSIKDSWVTPSIRADLKQMVESKTLQLRSLDDLDTMTVSFEGKVAIVKVEVTPGGAMFLQFNDAGWAGHIRETFEKQFKYVFGLPLNRLIDPMRLGMGGVRVVAHLLTIVDQDDVQPYQQEQFNLLVDEGILETESKPARICKSLVCRPKRPVADATILACPKCDKPIEDFLIQEVLRSDRATAALMDRIFTAAAGWSLGKPTTFESLAYYPLRKKDQPGSPEICVLLQERLSLAMKVKFQRSSQALMVVEPHTDDRYIYLDEDGIGRVSLAYLFTAQHDATEKARCATLCKTLIRNLLVHHNERIATAARQSYQHLQAGTSGDKGNVYETDVFNVLRSILPYSYQIGREGKPEPDGYVCVPVYEEPILEGVDSWNWGYDAKHSDKSKGYDLTSDECRKIVQYIEKFRAKVAFSDRSCKLRAHVIICNKIEESMVEKAAGYVYSDEGGVSKKNRDVRLVLMREEFLTRLYELVVEKKDEFQRRRLHFGKMLVGQLGRQSSTGYTVLERAEAEKLFADLIKVRDTEKAMTESELLSGLDG